MTAFLASVRSAAEARLVLPAGVDVLDVKEPDAGALGAVSDATLREIVACVNGAVPVSATIGDLPLVPELVAPAILRTWQAGVDIVKVGVFSDAVTEPVTSMLVGFSTQRVRIVLVFFAEQWRGDADFGLLRQAGVTGVMLDTLEKRGGSLLTKLGCAELHEFVRHARHAGLIAGLAGSLREADIPDLLAFSPHYIGFRGALCGGAGRTAAIDGTAVRRIANRLQEKGWRRNAITPRIDNAAPTTMMAAN